MRLHQLRGQLRHLQLLEEQKELGRMLYHGLRPADDRDSADSKTIRARLKPVKRLDRDRYEIGFAVDRYYPALDDRGVPRTELPTAADVQVVVDGRRAEMRDLLPGSPILIRLDEGGRQITGIEMRTSKESPALAVGELKVFRLKHADIATVERILREKGNPKMLRVAAVPPDGVAVFAPPVVLEDVQKVIEHIEAQSAGQRDEDAKNRDAGRKSPSPTEQDVVGWAESYWEAQTALETAREFLKAIEKEHERRFASKAALALARGKVRTAERRLQLLRSVLETKYEAARAELEAAEKALKEGVLPQSRLIRLRATVRILKQILDSSGGRPDDTQKGSASGGAA